MAESGTYREEGQAFERDMSYIPDRITCEEGRSQDPYGGQQLDVPTWPAEPGRYRLAAAKACPWANRAIIVRQLLGLEDVVSLALAGPTHDENSWTFDLDPGEKDPVLGIHRLQEAYFNRIPDYPKGITVPAVVEVDSRRVVTNDFPWITHDFFFEWRDHHRPDAPDLWPEAVREEMEQVMKRVFTEVNNGVYRCGFAGSQEAYDEAYDRLWTAMDWLEERLADRRFLMGHAHRGRRPAVHDPRPVRPGLPRPLQVQPEQADRDAEPLGLRPRPVPDPGVR
jgi:putative glutathione S-transferase